MTITRAKSKKAVPNICSEIFNKISTKKALFVVEATRQNILEVFLLFSNHEKLSLVAIKTTSSSLAGFSPVKILSKRHIWISPSVVSTSSKSPKIFNNRPVNKLVFSFIASISGASSTSSSKKIVKKTKSLEKWEQSLVFVIVTLNFFVVPNEILDEISITSSGISSKIGLNQPLAVLPNMVFSGKSLSVLEAKQSSSVGSSVLKNWSDQMETKLSSSLVSDATSGGAWETIASLYGFLGAKSVSKDNVKLFCVEFASQVSLEVVSLVELTSFIHLAIVTRNTSGNCKDIDFSSASKKEYINTHNNQELKNNLHHNSKKKAFSVTQLNITRKPFRNTILKIAKSLVVSESGFFSTAVVLHDMLLGIFAADIKTALSVFGVVTLLVDKDSVRILPLVNQQETIVFCDRFKTKLVNLLLGCTVFEISDMISQIGGWNCFIPRFLNFGHYFHFALVTFGSQANLDLAIIKTDTLRKCHIWWETSGCKCCFKCQGTGHLAVDCKMSLPSPSKTSKVFNSCIMSNVSYAKVFVSLNVSGFSPLVASNLLAFLLVAFFAIPIANSATKLKLNSMEKQILDLTALVKSIIKPIGSLVILVTTLLNDNTVKALKVEKDLLTMCNASRGFADLLVGVFKDFASLKAEIEFGNLDNNNIGAAKAFPLSDNTVDHVVALWQMCGPKVKDSSKKTRLFFNEFIFDSRNLNDIIKKLGKLSFLPASFDLT
ncbi:hypothetical protein G9A89_023710 [Geosiphon pyriformis]|nr:hypothetical protein G9A89_023710 [Geosiphon pyriformis]